MVSQKGGVGKSTLARLLAREFAALGWIVKIADLDISQATSFEWRATRLQNAVEPDVPVEQFGTVEKALKLAGQYDMLICDGAPHSTSATRTIAKASNLIIIPTGTPKDDLRPAVRLAHDLVSAGVEKDRIVFALCKVGDSAVQLEDARRYIADAGYHMLDGAIPQRDEYIRASDAGRALTETRFKSLNEQAEQVAQGIVDKITELTEARETSSTRATRRSA
jgi:chromosome partitioning protein